MPAGLVVGATVAATAITPNRLMMLNGRNVSSALLAGMWLADQGITVATGVSQWNDLSGNGHHLLQATAAKQPALSAAGGPNGGACVVADGVDDLLQAAWTQTQPEHIFVVAKYAAASGAGTLVDGAVSNTRRLFQVPGPLMAVFAGTTQRTSGVVAGLASWNYFSAQYVGGSASLNMGGVNLIATNTVGVAASGGLTVFSMGAAGFDWAAASIAAIIAFSRVLRPDEEARVNTYLQRRFGL